MLSSSWNSRALLAFAVHVGVAIVGSVVVYGVCS